jgi:hypothetical protein
MDCLLLLLAAAVQAGCHGPGGHNIPPASRLMHPGPGVGGPGPGVIPPVSALLPGMGIGATSQVAFLGADGMQIGWDSTGSGFFDAEPLVVPGRMNFPQGAIYRLKLTNIPGRPGVELYPTLEVAPATPRTDAFLAHSPVPVQFTQEDFDQVVVSGNYVTKVVYLPDPEFQELALAGVETLVSTRLDPGVDPIVEAEERGSILAIVRLGNKDLETPGVPGAVDGVIPATHTVGMGMPGHADGMHPMPMGMPTAAFSPAAMPPGVISGVNGPQWGMPFSGTPIGLPGPPHIPLGAPAGLTRHVMKNNTRVYTPHPVDTMHITVKQRPGMSYPDPVRHVHLNETNRAPLNLFDPVLGAGPVGADVGAAMSTDCP